MSDEEKQVPELMVTLVHPETETPKHHEAEIPNHYQTRFVVAPLRLAAPKPASQTSRETYT